MGLLAPMVEFFLIEHRYKKIIGDCLFIGRQTVFLNERSHRLLFGKYGITVPENFDYEFDTQTWGASNFRLMTDRSLLKSLGVDNPHFLDVTAYEGADIIHDLGEPIPKELHGRFDFIYNGGCFDNMFNPGVALMNLSKMLRPGGRLICMESASSWNGPYLIYSPGWFYDYFVTNNFSDAKVYLASYPHNHELMFGPWAWHYVNVSKNRNGPPPQTDRDDHWLVVSIAEKGRESTSDRQPIQFQYRVDQMVARTFDENERLIQSAERPIALAGSKTNLERYQNRLGKIGGGVPAVQPTSRESLVKRAAHNPHLRPFYLRARRFLREPDAN